MRWTPEQDEILFAYGQLGVGEVREALIQECGAERSVPAIQMRASRIGASLVKYEVCPKCGRRVRELTRSGWCRVCATRELTAAQRVRNEQLRQEVLKGCAEEERKALKEYNAIRARNLRLTRKIAK